MIKIFGIIIMSKKEYQIIIPNREDNTISSVPRFNFNCVPKATSVITIGAKRTPKRKKKKVKR